MPRRFGTSAQFSRLLLDASLISGMDLVRPHLSPLVHTIKLGDNEGSYATYLKLGGHGYPREVFGTPRERTHRLGTYAFDIAPVEYSDGFRMSKSEIRDATSPIWLQRAREMGALVPQFKESKLVSDIIVSATLFDGFDGQPLFSASHTWSVSDRAPGDPAPLYTTPQSNIYAAARGSYTSIDEVGTDFHAALAQMNGFVNDKGVPVHSGEGTYYVLYNNKTPALHRYLRGYFASESKPSDDSLRDGHQYNVQLIPTPHLPAVAGTSDFDWYLFRLIPGRLPPLVLQDRQAVESRTWIDDATEDENYEYTVRFGVGWNDWDQCIMINNA